MILNKKDGLLYEIQQHILTNSWVPQPDLALSAAMSVLSTIAARKYVLYDNCMNLYILNIGKSGSGKNAPQEIAKEILLDCGLTELLGAGDYVSDASLMDSLNHKPVRLDVIDEASGFLGTVNSSGNSYATKMADILCELYTSSNSFFPGRMLASGKDGQPKIKGACIRPYVNLLMSTTPRGFEQSVNMDAIDKGLLGRCMLFYSDRVRGSIPQKASLPEHIRQELIALAGKNPYDESLDTSRIITKRFDQAEHKMFVPEITEDIKDYLVQEFDRYRSMLMDLDEIDPMAPILARAFQMTCKLTLLHAVSRDPHGIPTIVKADIDFADKIITKNLKSFTAIVDTNLCHVESRIYSNIKFYIEKKNFVTKEQLRNHFRQYNKKQRWGALTELIEYGIIIEDLVYNREENTQMKGYRYVRAG